VPGVYRQGGRLPEGGRRRRAGSCSAPPSATSRGGGGRRREQGGGLILSDLIGAAWAGPRADQAAAGWAGLVVRRPTTTRHQGAPAAWQAASPAAKLVPLPRRCRSCAATTDSAAARAACTRPSTARYPGAPGSWWAGPAGGRRCTGCSRGGEGGRRAPLRRVAACCVPRGGGGNGRARAGLGCCCAWPALCSWGA
jgi:hypothetical protein